MFEASETTVITIVIVTTVGILFWGYRRAQAYGKLGKLVWVQSAVLLMPLVMVFGLSILGLQVNLAEILFFLILSTSIYIWLGNRLRAAGQDAILRERAARRLASESNEVVAPTESTSSNEPTAVKNRTDAPDITPMNGADLALIKEIFSIDTFFAVSTIPYQQGAIFKGNLRDDPEAVHACLSQKLTERLGDKYRLYLVEGPEDRPVIIVLPSSSDPQPANWPQKNLALVLLVATIVTLLETGGLLQGFDLFSHLNRLGEVFPFVLGLGLVLSAHEVGHRWFAKRHQVRLGWPFFLPSWQIGCFGAITRFESVIPHRTALFDVALAGPAAGGMASFLLLMGGLSLSHSGNIYQVPSTFFQGSILVGALAKLILGSALLEPLVNVHPLTIVGWIGLVTTALNLLPAGQLDGGRIIQGIYGRKMARRTTIATLIFLGIIAIINPLNSIPLYWGIFILFLQRELERPSLNELTEPDDARAMWGLLALLLMLITLIPLSPSLANQLGIGG